MEPHFLLNIADGNGNCLDTLQIRDYYAGDQFIAFGKDTLLTCSFEMTREELKRVCSSNGMYTQNIYTTWTTANPLYFGIFGNADPNFVSDWSLLAEREREPKISTWDEFNNECAYDSVGVNIVYSSFGSIDQEQFKINYAEISYSKRRRLRFTKEDFTQKQKFNHEFVLHWIKLNNAPSLYVAPAPSISPYLPDDVLYPFLIRGDATSKEASIFLTVSILVFVVLGLFRV
eukprot:TRINITY_DN27703_c0_g1_i1.p1 TRINITY_DN27703_c0_g1~~TRINITY_DN27703_c0_g1_i1.p1  ORF type:complete len:231 (+),score=38.28 TRINITY_DN27703_c0_g1_i1:792-1484(+)